MEGEEQPRESAAHEDPARGQTVLDEDGHAVPTNEERMWALAAHLGPIVTWPIAPLVVWLVKKDESDYVADQAKEALNFQITLLLVGLAMLLTCILSPLLFVLGIANIVFCVIAAMAANEGKRYRYPFAVRLLS